MVQSSTQNSRSAALQETPQNRKRIRPLRSHQDSPSRKTPRPNLSSLPPSSQANDAMDQTVDDPTPTAGPSAISKASAPRPFPAGSGGGGMVKEEAQQGHWTRRLRDHFSVCSHEARTSSKLDWPSTCNMMI